MSHSDTHFYIFVSRLVCLLIFLVPRTTTLSKLYASLIYLHFIYSFERFSHVFRFAVFRGPCVRFLNFFDTDARIFRLCASSPSGENAMRIFCFRSFRNFYVFMFLQARTTTNRRHGATAPTVWQQPLFRFSYFVHTHTRSARLVGACRCCFFIAFYSSFPALFLYIFPGAPFVLCRCFLCVFTSNQFPSAEKRARGSKNNRNAENSAKENGAARVLKKHCCKL